jgi:hypothetical protein
MNSLPVHIVEVAWTPLASDDQFSPSSDDERMSEATLTAIKRLPSDAKDVIGKPWLLGVGDRVHVDPSPERKTRPV